MLFLVEIDHVKSGDLPTPEGGRTFIERIILPTLARADQLVADKTIVAGGLAAGRIAPRFIVDVEAATDVDRLLFSLPLWPISETRVSPLVSFGERRSRAQEVLKMLATAVSRESS